MVTLVLYGLLAVLLAGVLFVAAAYLLPAGEQIAQPIRDEPIWELPAEKRLEHADVATVRLPVALRGYRFAETDLLLDRLADELQERDDEIARLRAGEPAEVPALAATLLPEAPPVPETSPAEPVTLHKRHRHAAPDNDEVIAELEPHGPDDA